MKKVSKKSGMKAYAKAGVDVDLGNTIKAGISDKVKRATRPEVLSEIGAFGGLFQAKFKDYKSPVLVSSIDGVGTKLKVASMMKRHDTIGQDLVNHCVNDIAVLGAEPLFFLDYLGTSHLTQENFAAILEGLVTACETAGCALIGGETAQMPGIYQGDDYDLVGTIVGVVDRKKIIDGKKIRAGDAILGFPSSGLHTNGYSLARDILFEKMKCRITDPVPGSENTVGEELLKVHVNYYPLLKKLSKRVTFKGLAHITGGGFLDNIPRVLPKTCDANIQLGAWPELPLFKMLASVGDVERDELYQVFNMGIGMVAFVSQEDAKLALRGNQCFCIGEVAKGTGKVKLID